MLFEIFARLEGKWTIEEDRTNTRDPKLRSPVGHTLSRQD